MSMQDHELFAQIAGLPEARSVVGEHPAAVKALAEGSDHMVPVRLALAPTDALTEANKSLRVGTRVVFVGSRAGYSNAPEVGEEGAVTTMPGFGNRTYLPGPGGGLLYVDWDTLGVAGVAPQDLEKVSKSKAKKPEAAPAEEAVAVASTVLDRLLDKVSPEDAKKWREQTDEHKDEFKMAADPNWKAVADKLLKARKGTDQDDLHYRAYLRAIIDGQPAQHMISKFKGAKEAQTDLIDETGKAPKKAGASDKTAAKVEIHNEAAFPRSKGVLKRVAELLPHDYSNLLVGALTGKKTSDGHDEYDNRRISSDLSAAELESVMRAGHRKYGNMVKLYGLSAGHTDALLIFTGSEFSVPDFGWEASNLRKTTRPEVVKWINGSGPNPAVSGEPRSPEDQKESLLSGSLAEAKSFTTKRDITSAKGVTIAKGEKVTLSWKDKDGKDRAHFTRLTDSAGNTVLVSTETLAQKVSGVTNAPSIATMEKWSSNGIAKSLLGAKVEPDGWDSDSSPSWLLALGMI